MKIYSSSVLTKERWQACGSNSQPNILEKSKIKKGLALWFTGLPGAGKSTLANGVSRQLSAIGYHNFVLDGDHIRQGLCSDLGFSDADRHENIRRISEVSRLFVDAGITSLVACISPFQHDRRQARALLTNKADFIEIWCKAPLDICSARDPKGWYKKALANEIKQFTGISSPYEQPESPEITIDTVNKEIKDCIQQIIDYLIAGNKISNQRT